MAADNTAPSSAPNSAIPPGSGRSTGGGVAGSHPEAETQPLLVAPTTASDTNLFGLEVIPVACWRVDDLRFAFDSSFVRAELSGEVLRLKSLREQHKKQVTPQAGGDPVTLYP